MPTARTQRQQRSEIVMFNIYLFEFDFIYA